jgi:hypothetical protein
VNAISLTSCFLNSQFQKGDPIVALHQRGEDWYDGKIAKVNRNGTYDILYADGDAERNLERKFISYKEDVGIDSRWKGWALETSQHQVEGED